MLVFRCDATAAIGMGHLVRCRSLATRLVAAGVHVTFLMRRGALGAPDLAAAGLDLVSLEVPPSVDGAPDLDEELDLLAPVLARLGARGVIVDHYGASPTYLEALHARVGFLGVIDDLADRDLRAADWILNQNPGAQRLPYRSRPGAGLLLGPAFALLRPQFEEVARIPRFPREPGAARLLITLGGGDTVDGVARLLEALHAVPQTLQIRCVLGSRDEEASARLVAAAPGKHELEVLHAVQDMARVMCWADVALCAGGVTCLELASVGTPALIVTTADNQRPGARELAALGGAVDLGDWDVDATPARAAEALSILLKDEARRRTMSEAGRVVVDGRGARRAADDLTRRLGGMEL